MLKTLELYIKKLKEKKPLILNLTNYVTMDFIANSLLAIGAAPIMTSCDQELEELIKIGNSLNINIGTLNSDSIKRYNLAIDLAKKHKKPIILDPVGCGATLIRTTTAKNIIKNVDIIRGNASEIISLIDSNTKTLGVETTNTIEEAKNIAIDLALKYKITVIVSGPIDFITNGINKIELPFGSNLMPFITGMGCALTSIVAAFKSIIEDSFESSKMSVLFFGLCGSLAEKNSYGPGSFRANFIDQLYKANFKEMNNIYNKVNKNEI